MSRIDKADYQELILSIIGITGVIAFTLLAPNCVQLLKYLPGQQSKKKYYTNTVIEKMKNQGLLEIQTNHQNQKIVRLTKKGQARLREYQLKKLTIKKPSKWDRKYRIIIFDIKEWKRSTRDKLRRWLHHLGLVRLQNSVWVSPYDCREIVAMIKANYRIGNEILYLEVTQIENDRWLRKFFNLPQTS
ncbi:MAG: CRISPR-associated endonuclease Cas2 [Candidatus Vogelbacteria bacterium CG10_big_fil_rev_8_21_14_0_10_49_38]|uniref:CRISPR-associated endonuclease Cas2 n=1 Tax=Candidatus Vogelbacteria bacterium CG10_big_fil_rev_8_21_14_0_10_49_38 TaxID=1975043 RepID=A0A2H0RI08_9BACT|nr:MAG: CRISPR-associated endonuclease Cas2 [bacterium CG10_49_38]PIR46191.1 MAG: CRISPR-associated endonuclease Cas2 [Candidatus Vogelbacteria bacterium CG10_big_fil_rev_8_21_14_0_10_49_38]